MRSWLAIGSALLAACARTEPEPEIERAAAQLAAAADPAAASALVTGAARGGCPGLRRALAALDRSRISGRLLSGLVDDAMSAAGEGGCSDSAAALDGGRAAPFQLARARALEERPAEALAQLSAGGEPALRLRRAELLAALDRPAEALVELEAFLASAPEDARARAARIEGLLALGRAADALAAAPRSRDPVLREARVAALAAAGRLGDAAAEVAAAPLPERPALARRAAALAPRADRRRLALQATALDVELATALADRAEAEDGATAALPLRERAAQAAPDRAELADGLARALAAAGRIEPALAAWDRAATAAPAQAAYRLAPIRALVSAGLRGRARARARSEAAAARRSRRADDLVTASAAAAAAGDTAQAARPAGEARAASPRDGRMAMLLGERQAEAGDRDGAAATWVELLVCGAHGRPWHRHEVAGRLVRLAGDAAAAREVLRALSAPLPCRPVDPDGLASYLDGAKKQLQAAQAQ